MKINEPGIIRMIDANLNRSREGLRVVEDIVRFVFDNTALQQRCKTLRHSITCIADQYFLPMQDSFCQRRNAEGDIGKDVTVPLQQELHDIQRTLTVNLHRAQEALRVLEECSKIVAVEASARYRTVRYSVYTLEKDISAIRT